MACRYSLCALGSLDVQDQLYLAFHGDDFIHRFTKAIEHEDRQRQQLDELVCEPTDYWARIPAEQRDFDPAKAAFMRWFV